MASWGGGEVQDSGRGFLSGQAGHIILSQLFSYTMHTGSDQILLLRILAKG